VIISQQEEAQIECLMLFKDGVEPKWEDPANAIGGSFVLEIDLESQEKSKIDLLWKTLVYGLVGNTFKFCDLVTGFRFMDRIKKYKTLKIELWTSISVTIGDNSESNLKKKKLKDQFTLAFSNLVKPIYDKISVNNIIFKNHQVVLKA